MEHNFANFLYAPYFCYSMLPAVYSRDILFSVLLLIAILISVLGYRLFYFSKEKKYLFFSLGFASLSLAFLLKLMFSFLPVIFVFGIPFNEFLYDLLFMSFVFFLLIALLKPRTFLELSLVSYVLIVSFIFGFVNISLFYVSLSLLFLFVAIYLFVNFLKLKTLESSLTFLGLLLLDIATLLNMYDVNLVRLFEFLAAIVFLIYVSFLMFKKTSLKKVMGERRK